MPKQPKPSKLIFMVKTAKRRTQPEEFKGELKMEHEQCHAWYRYISSELQKVAHLLSTQDWPPGHLTGITATPKAVQKTTEEMLNEDPVCLRGLPSSSSSSAL